MGPMKEDLELGILNFLDTCARAPLFHERASGSFEKTALQALSEFERSQVRSQLPEAGPSILSHPVPSPPRGPPKKRSRTQRQPDPEPLPAHLLVPAIEDEEPTAPATRSKRGRPSKSAKKKW